MRRDVGLVSVLTRTRPQRLAGRTKKTDETDETTLTTTPRAPQSAAAGRFSVLIKESNS
jgi:hypothetical protein